MQLRRHQPCEYPLSVIGADPQHPELDRQGTSANSPTQDPLPGSDISSVGASGPHIDDHPPDEHEFERLVPLTTSLVKRQLDRVGFKYSEPEADVLHARWKEFGITIRPRESQILMIGVTVSQTFPVAMHFALGGLCVEWNRTQYFLKAYPRITRTGTDDVRVQISLDVETILSAGIAPVQLQAHLRDVVDNAYRFLAYLSRTVTVNVSSPDAVRAADDSPGQ